jgi:hypothetical protein
MHTTATKPHNLDGRTIIEIAHQYGLSAREIDRALIDQARHYHLTPRPDGLRKTAADYFDGYLSDTLAEIDADGRAARDFEDRAYGCRHG